MPTTSGPRKAQIPDPSIFRRLRRTASDAFGAAVQTYAERERAAFVARIERQDFPSFAEVPLSRAWLRRKAAAGADLRTMIATEHYIRSIRVLPLGSQRRRRRRLMIGFSHNLRARDLNGDVVDITLRRVAWVQEHGFSVATLPEGGGGVPARPHWRPHLDDMHADAPEARERIKSQIRTAIRGMHSRRR